MYIRWQMASYMIFYVPRKNESWSDVKEKDEKRRSFLHRLGHKSRFLFTVLGTSRRRFRWRKSSTWVVVNTYLLVSKCVVDSLTIRCNNVITPLLFFNFKRFDVMNGHRVLMCAGINSVYMYFVKTYIRSLCVMLQYANIQNNRIAGTYIVYWSGFFQIILLTHSFRERVYDSMTARMYLKIY